MILIWYIYIYIVLNPKELIHLVLVEFGMQVGVWNSQFVIFRCPNYTTLFPFWIKMMQLH